MAGGHTLASNNMAGFRKKRAYGKAKKKRTRTGIKRGGSVPRIAAKRVTDFFMVGELLRTHVYTQAHKHMHNATIFGMQSRKC